MIFYDTEVFKYDWVLCWLDTTTKKTYHIVNDVDKLQKFYDHYANEIWVGYNSRNYDVWIIKAILCGFNPYDVSTWIIEKERKGFEYSRLLNNFPIINYDCSFGFRSLKELEAFMGHDIKETSVPFSIDRKLTKDELLETIEYCKNDVNETFTVFVETAEEFESHIGLIKEFDFGIENLNKTKAQLSALILGARKRYRNDEFEITLPDTLQLGKYQFIADRYMDWGNNIKDYSKMDFVADVCGVKHRFGIGGLHGAVENYYGDGDFLMVDVASYYPALMIEYDFLSRNVSNPKKYKEIRDERLEMKANNDPKEYPRKIVLNATFGACKDKYNGLYDPLQSNNVCIAGQLLLVDLLDKLEGYCELVQSNTDGLLLKLYDRNDFDDIFKICNDWSKRTRMELEYDWYRKVIQKDVNNYIILPEGDLYNEKGKELFKRKGAMVKKLSPLDNDLSVVNKAVVDYFINGTKPEITINNTNELIQFQKITKISNKYEYAVHNGVILNEKVHRVFATLDYNLGGTLYKKHRNKDTLDKTPSTPETCVVINNNIEGFSAPEWLDRNWYIELANTRIQMFLGGVIYW